jgi:hypothetical protein
MSPRYTKPGANSRYVKTARGPRQPEGRRGPLAFFTVAHTVLSRRSDRSSEQSSELSILRSLAAQSWWGGPPAGCAVQTRIHGTPAPAGRRSRRLRSVFPDDVQPTSVQSLPRAHGSKSHNAYTDTLPSRSSLRRRAYPGPQEGDSAIALLPWHFREESLKGCAVADDLLFRVICRQCGERDRKPHAGGAADDATIT